MNVYIKNAYIKYNNNYIVQSNYKNYVNGFILNNTVYNNLYYNNGVRLYSYINLEKNIYSHNS